MALKIVIGIALFVVGFLLGTTALYFHNKWIRNSSETVGELQIVYEVGQSSPLIFFVSYIPVNDLERRDTARMIVRVKNM